MSTLQGLQSLVKFPTFGAAETTTIIESLFRHVKTKALTQNHRFKVFTIVDTLMANHREVLKAMGVKFLDGYAKFCDGEKDPRNLVLIFAIDRVILIEFDISERVQTLYDVIFCYFPITFRPPPNNPGGITADDLRVSLRAVVSATPLFGTLAIPHYLENLVAVGRPAKKDILETIAVCLPVYGSQVARSFARKLWNSLKLEVFQPVDPITEELAVKAIQVLIKTIYSSEKEESQTDVQGLAKDACEECITILREPEKSQARPAARILCSFMTTTASVSKYTVSQAVPHLTKLFINPDEVTSRPATLVLLAQFIEAARDSMSSDLTGDVPLLPYKDDVLGALSGGLKAHNLRIASLTGLKGMVTTERLLTDQELGFIVHSVNEIIQDHPDQFDDISDGILELLSTISEVCPRQVVEQTLPILFSSLPDSAPPREAASERAQTWKTLSYLQTLCTEPELFEVLVIRLTTKLEFLCSRSSSEEADPEPTAGYAHAILKTLANTLSTKLTKNHTDVAKYLDRLVVRIFNIFVYAAFTAEGDKRPMILSDHRLLEAAALCTTSVVRSLPTARQQSYLQAVMSALTNGVVQPISEGYFKIPPEARLAIFGVNLNVPNLVQFLEGTLGWILNGAENDLQRNSAVHLVSVLVNRKAEELSGFLDGLATTYWSQEILNTEKLLDLFSDTSINWDAAKGVGLIPGHDSILTKQNHAVVKILYAQKYVAAILPQTIAGSVDGSEPTKQVAYLVALSGMIKSAPKATYMAELPSLIPLLIRGLDLPDPDIRRNVIETLLAAAEGETPEKSLVAEHASTLVNAMLKNCLVEEMPSSNVRISALRYLAVLPRIVRYDVLHPYKAQVIKDLGKTLDDPKRAVRKEAVEARFKYNG
ncbi:hypothetical protein H1R20_g3061, partial [Candolleomyces eurysporus]